MSPHEFQRLIAGVTEQLAGRPLDGKLAVWLNDTYPVDGDTFRELAAACRSGVADGWLCQREGGGIRYGRVFKALPDTHGFSVDVVDMKNIAGPHHVHPNGEIDLIMPLTEGATFDRHPAGWCVYGPGSAHRPTVSNGEALVLYLLPQGAIEFTPA
ncbi:hypothetical protein BCh11DRAFT_05926 [Burkholderia sp. Ch1-1]|uniref:p-hydroxylaminobenzoate lyase n=1 Tax=Paraburkholderia dioscoreae TaxID=2604047 RepID=A0A5Q4Z2B5_9BURK|nr:MULTISPECIES: DUF4863 family protein [Paraburkholderia]EIF30436.1 hypothetical protein BCh11DRAFT_05926 [Burkholderia sp. Ch1-1]MDR8395136.1 DUF4863 family protein [Paraburkholderia sp. USG1]VVD29470.1 conserved protein of unknown function [Paraburkholderia dioscoreae]